MTYQKYKKEDLFFCYSLNLFHHLKANGFFYLFKEVNPSTNRHYWAFKRSPELSDALDVYSNSK